MPTPSEHKTVQARILAYAQESGWTLVSRAEADVRRASSSEGYAGTRGQGAETMITTFLTTTCRERQPSALPNPVNYPPVKAGSGQPGVFPFIIRIIWRIKTKSFFNPQYMTI